MYFNGERFTSFQFNKQWYSKTPLCPCLPSWLHPTHIKKNNGEKPIAVEVLESCRHTWSERERAIHTVSHALSLGYVFRLG